MIGDYSFSPRTAFCYQLRLKTAVDFMEMGDFADFSEKMYSFVLPSL